MDVAVIVITANIGVLDGTVNPLDLAVGPGMVWLRQLVFNLMALSDASERVCPEQGRRPLSVLRRIGELDSVNTTRLCGKHTDPLPSSE